MSFARDIIIKMPDESFVFFESKSHHIFVKTIYYFLFDVFGENENPMKAYYTYALEADNRKMIGSTGAKMFHTCIGRVVSSSTQKKVFPTLH